MSDPLKARAGRPVRTSHSSSRWEAGCQTDANYHMLYAAKRAAVLRRPDLARQHYDAALRIDRRPEIFMQRGLTALESGKRRAGRPRFRPRHPLQRRDGRAVGR